MIQTHLRKNNTIILSFIIIIMLFILMLACFSSIAYTILYLIFPSILTIFCDRSDDKCLFISIAFFNLSGIFLSLAKPMIQEGEQMAFILKSGIILHVYMFSTIGLFFYLLLPQLLKSYNLQLSSVKNMRSKLKINLIKKTWEITSC